VFTESQNGSCYFLRVLLSVWLSSSACAAPTGRISVNFYTWISMKVCRGNPNFVKIGQKYRIFCTKTSDHVMVAGEIIPPIKRFLRPKCYQALRPSVRLSTCICAPPTWRISKKFRIGDFHENMLRNSKFLHNRAKLSVPSTTFILSSYKCCLPLTWYNKYQYYESALQLYITFTWLSCQIYLRMTFALTSR
jgi:hypothetical protein